MGWRRKRVKRDAPTGGKKQVPDFGKPKGRQIIGQIKQFRVKLWLEGEEENALGLRQSSWVLDLNVKLRQQKLYKTTFDGQLAPPPLAESPAAAGQRPAPGARRERPGASRPREHGHGGLVRGGRKGQACSSGWKDPSFHAQPTWGAGRARRAGRRLLPGNLGRRAGALPAGSASRSFVAQPRPAQPCSSQGCRHPENV